MYLQRTGAVRLQETGAIRLQGAGAVRLHRHLLRKFIVCILLIKCLKTKDILTSVNRDIIVRGE